VAALEDVEAAGDTDLVALFQLSEAERRKPGVSFIISDFFDPAGLEPIARALNLSAERCVLVRIFEPQDKSGGSFAGELHLVDCESGLGLDADVDDRLRARYCEAFSRFEQEFDNLLLSPARAGCALDATRPVLGQLEPLFPAGSLSL
jgi:hypothetical protein